MSNEVEISDRIEKMVWKRLGNTPVRKIAEETGLTREQVIAIREELLDSVDELTINQKRQKLIVELEAIAQAARTDAENADGRDKGPMYTAAVGAIKTMLQEIARMEKTSSQAVESLNAKRISALVRLVQETVNTSVREISETHSLNEDEVFRVFNSNLASAAEKMHEEGVD